MAEDNGEYRDGEFEYGVTSALIEDIINYPSHHLRHMDNDHNYRAYFYMESDSFDNILTTTVIRDSDSDEIGEEMLYNTLMNLVVDILKDKEGDDRNAAIAAIYDEVYAGIHIDEVCDDFDDESECDY